MSAKPVALITAGSAGLGAATAKLFARSGFRVAVNFNNNEARANDLVQQLRSSTEDAEANDFIALRADLADRDAIYKLVDATVDHFGRLDVVFSNGGWTNYRDITNLDDNVVEDDWDRCYNMNVKSHLFLMHASKSHLDKTSGCFIATASLAGVTVSGSSLAYSISKAAQLHLIKGLAKSAGPNIRVNSVSPGLMLTDWAKTVFPEHVPEATRERTPLKRLVTVEDVAEQVLCFVRSKSVTGANAVIDGGLSL
ncbi:uncharacterized protein F5Z01DRAFT_695764 [Emericellopsis atlantica]|uniref:Granaticin polyketide synthase ketoacyl reductase 2 n=1 Tax=Emericellopsis atlantica TaxID=2614577 RepID=A0A9P7ZDX1_9HYPO|nr:uncharacterized protein F5Z01DRAFT_695764 [Emericellopsis atlantica]KAG9249997.1 hypothetical protein F5Z01DRAFT_695764 [Emericellopsis atlantica]